MLRIVKASGATRESHRGRCLKITPTFAGCGWQSEEERPRSEKFCTTLLSVKYFTILSPWITDRKREEVGTRGERNEI